MKKLIAIAISATCLTGCLSVVRFAKLDKPTGTYTTKVWSEEKMAYVEETIQHINNGDPLQQFGLFPTLGMRWDCLKTAWGWYPPSCNWFQRRIGLTCATVLLTPGLIVDIPVDLISLPWDWKYLGGGETPYDREQKERKNRSVCHFCGATNEDGRYGLCEPSIEQIEREKLKLGTMYGCCPACVERAKSEGYRFRYR